MNKKTQARDLYAQTDLTKTQIAGMLGLHRNTLSIWVREGDWDRLKQAAHHLPAIIAENCYHIMGHLTEHYLSEWRLTRPVTHKEADTLHKLASTISKLRARATLNESMEMMGYFLHHLRRQNKKLAAQLSPYIDKYISARAQVSVASLIPADFTAPGGRIPAETPEQAEERQQEIVADNREHFYSDPDTIAFHTENNIPLPPDMQPEKPQVKLKNKQSSKHSHTTPPSPKARAHTKPHSTTSPLGRPGGAAHNVNATPKKSDKRTKPAQSMHNPCTIPAQKTPATAQEATTQITGNQETSTPAKPKIDFPATGARLKWPWP